MAADLKILDIEAFDLETTAWYDAVITDVVYNKEV